MHRHIHYNHIVYTVSRIDVVLFSRLIPLLPLSKEKKNSFSFLRKRPFPRKKEKFKMVKKERVMNDENAIDHTPFGDKIKTKKMITTIRALRNIY